MGEVGATPGVEMCHSLITPHVSVRDGSLTRRDAWVFDRSGPDSLLMESGRALPSGTPKWTRAAFINPDSQPERTTVVDCSRSNCPSGHCTLDVTWWISRKPTWLSHRHAQCLCPSREGFPGADAYSFILQVQPTLCAFAASIQAVRYGRNYLTIQRPERAIVPPPGSLCGLSDVVDLPAALPQHAGVVDTREARNIYTSTSRCYVDECGGGCRE